VTCKSSTCTKWGYACNPCTHQTATTHRAQAKSPLSKSDLLTRHLSSNRCVVTRAAAFTSHIQLWCWKKWMKAYHWRCCCQQWGVVHQPLQWPQSPPASLQDCAGMTPAQNFILSNVYGKKGREGGGGGEGEEGGYSKDKMLTMSHDNGTSHMSAVRTCTMSTSQTLPFV